MKNEEQVPKACVCIQCKNFIVAATFVTEAGDQEFASFTKAGHPVTITRADFCGHLHSSQIYTLAGAKLSVAASLGHIVIVRSAGTATTSFVGQRQVVTMPDSCSKKILPYKEKGFKKSFRLLTLLGVAKWVHGPGLGGS
ncbi:uncharacterized protein LOC131152431 [Malania oleifera]|uniref:uncharacterized protein LOC131152431 n=1 Tax=Malania oleifera TaxID=397392 RepID=UPI0025ADC930|nr:uncharacterized protein LOC131152431 [Malania oleifera]